MRHIQLFCCISASIFVAIQCELELKDIYLASKKAIESGNVTENQNVLDKYYLTHEKETSVWYISQKTALSMFNIGLSIEELSFIEKLILSFANHYKECIQEPGGAIKGQCFYHLAPKALDLEKGSRWISSPEISIENRVKFGTLYHSVSLFISHVALIAKENVEVFKDFPLSQFKLGDYRKALENVQRMLYDFDIGIVDWRIDAISPPTICEINQRFWKDFEGICETRWRRSVDNDDAFDETDFESKEEDSSLRLADRIGSSCRQGCIRFRVQIVDGVTKTVLYEKESFASASSKGGTLDKLAISAQEARGKFARDIKENVTKLAENTYIPIYDVIGNTLTLMKQ